MGGVSNFSDSNSTNNQDELRTDESLRISADSTTLNLTTTAIEGKVSGSALADRKYVLFKALDKKILYGFSNTNQSFTMAENETIYLPISENISIWFKMETGTGNLAFAEFS